MKNCINCGIKIEEYINYCSWDCQIFYAQANGGEIICPNNLSIRCITANNAMLECEHGDHPDYKFPVEAEYKGSIPQNLPDWDTSFENETHALIYTDGSIVLTLYEATYYVWYINDGYGWGKFNKEWYLTDNSIEKIKEYIENK